MLQSLKEDVGLAAVQLVGHSGNLKLKSILRQNSSVTLNTTFCKTASFSGEKKCFTGETGCCSGIFDVNCCLSLVANAPAPAVFCLFVFPQSRGVTFNIHVGSGSSDS